MKIKSPVLEHKLSNLLVLFSFLFTTVTIAQHGDHYYYYKGSKIGIELNKQVVNISVFSGFMKDNLKNVNLKNYDLKADKSQIIESDLRYAKIEFASTLSIDEYHQKFQEIKNAERVRTIYPSFFGPDGKEIGLSDYLYVKLKHSSDYSILEQKAAEFGIEIIEQDQYMPLWYTLRCSETTALTSLEIANALFETDLFASSIPDLLTYEDIQCTNDPDFAQLWGLLNDVNPSADINICNAWTISKGSGIKLAILDTGIELTHIDLAANLSPLSYDTESNSSPSLIFNSHGTHCAGTAGAVGGNTTQVIGVAPESTLFSISNSFAPDPNSRQKRADGINWAVMNGVDIISNSWISSVQYDIIDDAIDNALQFGRGGLGCILVFAVGNNNGSPVAYPANYHPDILAVGAISSTGLRSVISNIGPELDVVAPGANILSTVLNNSTGYSTGTSMATPHVAGLAALILAVNPSLTVAEVNNIIEQTAFKNPVYTFSPTAGRPNGDWNNEMGYGLINAQAAVQLALCPTCNLTCNNTVTSFPFTESFETDFGLWEQSTLDDFNWRRWTGNTATSNTGPSTAADGSYYAYVESSAPNYPSKSTILTSPCLDLTDQDAVLLTFSYHMFGSTMGTLRVEVSNNSGFSWNTVWSLSGDQGDVWQSANVDLSSYYGTTILIRFVGITSNGYYGDMAIDGISIHQYFPCNTTISTFPYSESFETSFGAWEHVTTDDFDWSRIMGATPTPFTGPDFAANGDYYAFVKSSHPNNPYKKGMLVSPCFDLAGQSAPIKLDFQYHMYGSTMGKLVLEISTDTGVTWTEIWSEMNDQGNQWLSATVNLDTYIGSKIQLKFTGFTSNGHIGDIAIDDIIISPSTCNGIISTFPFIESFETDFGLWSQDITEDFDWTRHSGPTSSLGTGPESANDGLWYVYTESSFPNNPFKTARLISPCIDLRLQPLIVYNFWYHMLGNTMGDLSVEITQDGGQTWNTIFAKSGQQSKLWIQASVNLAPYYGQIVQMRIVGITGNGYQSDMAIDDMTFYAHEGGKNNEVGNGVSNETEVIIYPNPATDQVIINLQSVDSDAYTVSIIDILGKEVYSSKGQNGIDLNVSTDRFAPGTYLVQIITNNGETFNKKLVVRN